MKPRLVRKGISAAAMVLIAIFAALSNLPAQSSVETSPPPAPAGAKTAEGEPSSLVLPKARPRKPMPLAAKLAIVIGGLGVALAALFVSVRAWRSSNLFDRQYRFPENEDVALRLGGERSGGCIAVLQFETGAAESGAEDG